MQLFAQKNVKTYEKFAQKSVISAKFYYRRDDSRLEEDFFIRTADSLVPVEVKAANGRSKSLSTLIKSDHYPDIRFGVKLGMTNIGFENQIYTFPFFCGFLLKQWRDQFM